MDQYGSHPLHLIVLMYKATQYYTCSKAALCNKRSFITYSDDSFHLFVFAQCHLRYCDGDTCRSNTMKDSNSTSDKCLVLLKLIVQNAYVYYKKGFKLMPSQ